MKTKIVYCLVSNNQDYYYEQLLISLCSLRKHNPDAEVEVVCDHDTFITLTGNRRGIFEYKIQLTSIDTPKEWEQWERSRYLKTNLRQLIKGDYLYLDTDTVICSSLDFIDDFPFEIAAVHDSHLEQRLPKFSQCKFNSQYWIWKAARIIDINIEGSWHFNSGVMYVKDTPKAYALYAKWFDRYQRQLKHGIKVDQLPLLLSNREMNDVIFPLNWRLNCQVPFDGIRNKVAEASIIHYFPVQNTTLLSSPWILDPIKESGVVNVNIRRIIDNPTDFFNKTSKIFMENEVTLSEFSSFIEIYRTCPKMFKIWMPIIKFYIGTKKRMKALFVRMYCSCKFKMLTQR